MQCSPPTGHAPHKIRPPDGRSQQGTSPQRDYRGRHRSRRERAPNLCIQRQRRGSGLGHASENADPQAAPTGVNRFGAGAPRMRFSRPHSGSYATLHSGEARRGLAAAMRTVPPEPVADRPSFDRRRPAPMKVRRHTRSERSQSGGLSSRISFPYSNTAAPSPVVSKRSFDHEADPKSDVHVSRTDKAVNTILEGIRPGLSSVAI